MASSQSWTKCDSISNIRTDEWNKDNGSYDIENAGPSTTNFTDQPSTAKEASFLVLESTTNNRTNILASKANSSKEIVRTSTSNSTVKTTRNDEGTSSHLKIGISSLLPIPKNKPKKKIQNLKRQLYLLRAPTNKNWKQQTQKNL